MELRRFEIYEETDSSDDEVITSSGGPAAPPLQQHWDVVAGWRFRSGDPSLAAMATIPLQQVLVGAGERYRGEVVERPLHLYRAGLVEQGWSEQEQRVFVRKFRKNNFVDIAKALPRKTVKDCVKNFYRNKKRIFEKGKGKGG